MARTTFPSKKSSQQKTATSSSGQREKPAARHALTAITGASGFIGSAVLRILLAEGRKVRVILQPGADQRNLAGLPPFELVESDVSDAAGMQSALKGVDTLYHLAALYRTWLPDRDLIYRINVGGTTTTLLAAQQAGVKKIIHTSSVAAVGTRSDGTPSDETVAFNHFAIANDYILSKHLSEQVVMRFAANGLPVTIVNPGFPFGPRDSVPTPTGAMVRGVLRNEIPAVSSGGFCAIDVDDLAAGHVAAERHGRIGERYILANHNVEMVDFAKRTAKLTGNKMPMLVVPKALTRAAGAAFEWWADHVSHEHPVATYKSVRYIEQKNYFDNKKARDELGLPTRPLDETIQRSIDYFRTL